MKRHALLIGLGLALMLLFVGSALKIYPLPFVTKLEHLAYDSKLRLTMPGTVDDRIVILDIDEKSLKEEGHWPWSRLRMAQLMDKLFERHKVAVAGFDVVFAERDESSGLKTLEQLAGNQMKGVPQFRSVLKKIRPQLEYDRLFAEKIANRKVVLGYYFSAGGNAGNVSGVLPEPVFPAGAFEGRALDFARFSAYGANLPELEQKAAAAGHFNPVVHDDGVVRRVPMIAEYNGAYYESLSLAMVRTLLGAALLAPRAVGGDSTGMDWIALQSAHGRLKIPMDVDEDVYGAREISTLVPYRGLARSFPYISISDVLHDRIPAGALKDKIVLIGTSAPGLEDLRSTPVDPAYPGVEVHANMISGILDQDIKQKPGYMAAIELVVLVALGGALSLLLPMLSPVRIALVGGGALIALEVFNISLWQGANLDLPVANALMLVVGLFVLNMSYGYFIEARTKHQITSLFGQYVPKELVREMTRHPEQISTESDSREMTILFSDVRGFTSISEAMDPRELSQFMNEFLTPFSRIIYGHRGTIDKYMGDCIMAFWGAPLHSATHARDAVLAGLEMLSALGELQRRFRARGWPEITIGIGVNTGRVNVGNMGSEVRVAYTVMGDAVNLASRLEGVTKQYGVAFIVGEATRQAASDLVYRELDLVRVLGKDKPVVIYEPIGADGTVGLDRLEEIKVFQQMLRMYRNQEWDKAELQLYNLRRMSPEDRLYQVYADRIAYFRGNPPPADWDGAFDWQTK